MKNKKLMTTITGNAKPRMVIGQNKSGAINGVRLDKSKTIMKR